MKKQILLRDIAQNQVHYQTKFGVLSMNVNVPYMQSGGFFFGEHFKNPDGSIKEFLGKGEFSAKLIKDEV